MTLYKRPALPVGRVGVQVGDIQPDLPGRSVDRRRPQPRQAGEVGEQDLDLLQQGDGVEGHQGGVDLVWWPNYGDIRSLSYSHMILSLGC